MRKRVIILGLTTLLFTSCEHTYSTNQLMVHQDGRTKPKLLLMDVLDHSNSILPWDLAAEFNLSLNEQLQNFGTIYLKNFDDLQSDLDPIELSKTIQRTPQKVPSNLPGIEFLAAIELIEHRLVPLSQKPNVSHPDAQTQNLNIRARLKIFDLRKKEPELILSEIIRYQSYIPWQLSTINYKKHHYLTTQYKITPIGLGNKQISQSIAQRIHDYVLIGKSR